MAGAGLVLRDTTLIFASMRHLPISLSQANTYKAYLGLTEVIFKVLESSQEVEFMEEDFSPE